MNAAPPPSDSYYLMQRDEFLALHRHTHTHTLVERETWCQSHPRKSIDGIVVHFWTAMTQTITLSTCNNTALIIALMSLSLRLIG